MDDADLYRAVAEGAGHHELSSAKIALRKDFIEGEQSDPKGFERILGKSDLLSINFLDRGRRAADAVCRIRLPIDGGMAYATGFLVGPRLLLTNNHVLATPAEAMQAEAEFAYDHDLDGVIGEPATFNFDPQTVFFTDGDLDVTLVAVVPLSDRGVPLSRFGWLPLIPLTGKTVDGEWVSAIQHPQGLPKQIAIHASQIVQLTEAQASGIDLARFIHYSTDTEPGSSGSPVFNDQWQVVALHHRAVTAPLDGTLIANEGVRISAIFRLLEGNRLSDPDAGSALDALARGLGFTPIAPATATDEALEQYGPLPAAHWTRPGLGYDAGFLSSTIPLDAIAAPLVASGAAAPLLDGSGHELKYWHYSAVIHAERKFAALTAVNIDGRKLRKVTRKDTWRRDARIAGEFQPDDDFYVKSRAEEAVYFSRGHLVRLLDPCWGDSDEDARRGMEDSFHFTNAAPQFQTYNDIDWGNLEDYVLDKAQTTERKLTVFTGPIYRPDDPLYGQNRVGGPWRIPLSFWKIAVLQKTATQIAAAAFIIGQIEYVRALYEAKVFSGLKPYSVDELRQRHIQTTIATVEDETGLDFSSIRAFDAHGSLESTRQTRWINQLSDVKI